jgi:hypothetical protein
MQCGTVTHTNITARWKRHDSTPQNPALNQLLYIFVASQSAFFLSSLICLSLRLKYELSLFRYLSWPFRFAFNSLLLSFSSYFCLAHDVQFSQCCVNLN